MDREGVRRYDREYLLWQSTVAIRSDPVGSEDIGRAIAINAVGHRECCAHDIERAVPEWLVGAHGR